MKRALLIPGLGGTEDCWPGLFTGRLGSRYSVDTVTLPHRGSSIRDFARELLPEEPPALLIGFSIGSAVIQEMLAENPDLPSSMVLMAPPAGSDYPPPPDEAHDFSDGRGKWSASMLEMMFTPEWLAAHPDVTEFFPRVKRSVPGESLIIQSRAISSWEGCLKKLGRVRTPVLIISGRYDIITPPVHAGAIAASIPDSRLLTMDTGHGFPWQCPVETADAILEFAD